MLRSLVSAVLLAAVVLCLTGCPDNKSQAPTGTYSLPPPPVGAAGGGPGKAPGATKAPGPGDVAK